jgi:hypothetical protein
MATLDKASYIFRKGVTPNTLSVISSKNRIFAFDAGGEQSQLGVVATFDPSEARTIEPVRGIGFGDQIAELVPGVTDPMTISVTRTALYLSNIFQVFGYKAGIDGICRSLKHHRWPFDIRQELVFSDLASAHAGSAGQLATEGGPEDVLGESKNGGYVEKAVITYYEACWISDYSVSFASDTALVQETVTINVSDIYSASDKMPKNSAWEDYSTLNKNEKGLSARYAQTYTG